MFGNKPLTKPILTYLQGDTKQYKSVKFEQINAFCYKSWSAIYHDIPFASASSFGLRMANGYAIK